jgi:hypothetical protein
MLFKRKEIWVPTWKGWLLFFVSFVALVVGAVAFTPAFLAPTKPLGAPVLVVEGWVSDYALERAIKLNETNHYALVITSGQNIERGLDVSHYGTYAELGAERLVNLGFKGTNLVKVPAPPSKKDRTYHSALAVRSYLLTNTTYRSIDILSDSVHSRRTWLLYEKACGPEIKVGIISNPNDGFTSSNWWHTSNGVRNVINEAIGYLYARLVFRPD